MSDRTQKGIKMIWQSSNRAGIKIGWGKDGGPSSTVKGFFFQIKCLFSVVLLRFSDGERPVYHSHAFNAWTLFLGPGTIKEFIYTGPVLTHKSWTLKYTPCHNCHRVHSIGTTWAISVRGPWRDTWIEQRPSETVWLTHGRKVVKTAMKGPAI